ncbi:PREDICTED: proline-rich protein 2-like [Cyprinodon variegatus]|uniref:proline-rich protein 2-like n=1 Tax=Cyprinodon variegatus TaxID=28743 RepID=UPI000742BE66|nr:PREDICTED: proline-rich protein 2-like [Cyprinodon variegatus]
MRVGMEADRAQQAPRHSGTPEAAAAGVDSRAHTGPDPKQHPPQNPSPRNPNGAPARGQCAPGIPDPRTHPGPTQQRQTSPPNGNPTISAPPACRGPSGPDRNNTGKADTDKPTAPTEHPGGFPHPKTQRNRSIPPTTANKATRQNKGQSSPASHALESQSSKAAPAMHQKPAQAAKGKQQTRPCRSHRVINPRTPPDNATMPGTTANHRNQALKYKACPNAPQNRSTPAGSTKELMPGSQPHPAAAQLLGQ